MRTGACHDVHSVVQFQFFEKSGIPWIFLIVFVCICFGCKTEDSNSNSMQRDSVQWHASVASELAQFAAPVLQRTGGSR